MSDTTKVHIVRKYHDLLNDGKLADAHKILSDNVVASFSAGTTLSKAEVLQSQEQTVDTRKEVIISFTLLIFISHRSLSRPSLPTPKRSMEKLWLWYVVLNANTCHWGGLIEFE